MSKTPTTDQGEERPMPDDLTPEEKIARRRITDVLGPAPERWKPIEDYTPTDHERRHRGERIESDEFREYEAKIRNATGIGRAQEPDLESMTPADFARAKYGREENR